MLRILKYWYLRFWQIVTFFLPDHYFICHFRGWLIKPVLKHAGKKFGLAHDVKIIFPEGCSFGDGVFLANGAYIHGRGGVEIGNNVSVAPYCVILSAQRKTVSAIKGKRDVQLKSVKIENHVYMGSHVVVMPGVTIGENSLISPGVVVSRKIKPECMVMAPEPRIIKKPSMPAAASTAADNQQSPINQD